MSDRNRGFLEARVHQRERMDSPDIDPSEFAGALRGLARVNHFTRGAAIVWPHLRVWAASQGRPLRVLDVACGGGDTAIALANRFRRMGLEAKIDGCDLSESAVEIARANAARVDADVDFFRLDAVSDSIPREYDVIMSTLFLHHLERRDAILFLKRSAEAAGTGLLIQDLVRSRAGWWTAYAGVRLLLCNAVCREDGPRSVECAFTADEARELASDAGLADAKVARRFPYRYVLSWEKRS